MLPSIRVAVVDDHPLVREGIIHAIGAAADDIMVVGEGATAAEAVELVRTLTPDVLLLDLNIPGLGLVALGEIARMQFPTRVIVLTVSEDSGDVMEALRSARQFSNWFEREDGSRRTAALPSAPMTA